MRDFRVFLKKKFYFINFYLNFGLNHFGDTIRFNPNRCKSAWFGANWRISGNEKKKKKILTRHRRVGNGVVHCTTRRTWVWHPCSRVGDFYKTWRTWMQRRWTPEGHELRLQSCNANTRESWSIDKNHRTGEKFRLINGLSRVDLENINKRDWLRNFPSIKHVTKVNRKCQNLKIMQKMQ